MAASDPLRSTAGLAASVAWRHRDETTYCLDGQAYTVGAAVSWLRELGLIDDASGLDQAAPDARGVVFVPALAGLGAPFWKPGARGVFAGLSLATSRAELARAVIDGIAAQVAWLARAAAWDVGAPLTRLRVDGGLTRSRVLLQTQADLMQVPVDVYASPHATALGVAALARVGAGGTDLASAVPAWTPSTIFEPKLDAGRADDRLGTWRRTVEATMDLAL